MQSRGIALAELTPRGVGGWVLDRRRVPGDPADRLIYATARDLRVLLVSKDERMHSAAAQRCDVRVIW